MPAYTAKVIAEKLRSGSAKIKIRQPNGIQIKEIMENGQKIKLFFVSVIIEIDGKNQSLMIQLPETLCPVGVKVEEKGPYEKMKVLTIFDGKDQESIDTIVNTERTQRSGFVKKSKVKKVEKDDDDLSTVNMVVSKDGDLEIYDSAKGEVKFEVPEDEELFVFPVKGEKDWYSVKTKGTEGHFEYIQNKIKECIFDNKEKTPLSEIETIEQVKYKSPVYNPRVKETGAFDMEKSPSAFFQVFTYKDLKTGEEKFCPMTRILPGGKTVEDHPNEYHDMGFKCKMVLNCGRFLIRSGGFIYPQFKVQSAVVTEIVNKEQRSLQADEIEHLKVSLDDEKLKKSLELWEAKKKNRSSPSSISAPSVKKAGGGTKPPREETDAGTDIDALLGGLDKDGIGEDDEIELELPESGDVNPEVPGLED